MLQCVAVCRRVTHGDDVDAEIHTQLQTLLKRTSSEVCCRVLRCAAVCCSVTHGDDVNAEI